MDAKDQLNLNSLENLKMPPHSLETEESALGSMMLSKEAITASIEILKTEDFYQDAHRKIYDAILNIYNRNEPADVITIAEELKKTDSLEEVGGITYLADLSSNVTAVSNIRSYCKIIKEKGILRELINASDKIISAAYSSDAKADLIIELAEKSVFDITQDSTKNGLVNIKNIALESFSDLEKKGTKSQCPYWTYNRLCRS